MNIKKVVIPAAGLGTRWAPWSKSVPKELLPLGNTPTIECVVKEAIEAGCSDMVIIAGARKHAIIDYFEKSNLPATFTYIPQPDPKGLAHAISMAEPIVKEDFFAVMLPDELFFGESTLKQLMEVAQREQASVVAVIEVPWEKVSSYGVITIKKQLNDRLFEITGVMEKPKREEAPSNLILPGRYILSSTIFQSFKTIGLSIRGEFELTDAITDLVDRGERVLAYKVEGIRHDVGNPLGWMKALISSSLDSKQYEAELKDFIMAEFIRRYGNTLINPIKNEIEKQLI